MMGRTKLSTIRNELRAAFAREGSNPIRSLDRRIRSLKKKPESAQKALRSLVLLRDALAQVIDDKAQKRARPPRAKRPGKAV
jgi:hypothetical protein